MGRKLNASLVLALLTTVIVLVLSACGASKAAPDPFVGTWADPTQPESTLVIVLSGSHYQATTSKAGRTLHLEFSRDGNTLTALSLPAGFFFKPIARYDPATGILYFSPFGKGISLRRTSSPSSGSQ
jgi:hypothetical protein